MLFVRRCPAATRNGCARLLRRWSSSSSEGEDDIFEDRMNIKVSEDKCSYGVRKIKEWIKARELDNTYRVRRIVDPLVHTGMYIEFPHLISMSVETHPMVCTSDFAETALMPTLETVEDPSYTKELESPRLILLEPLGYNERAFCLKHKEPSELFDHILKLRKLLLKATAQDGIVELPGGETIDMRAPWAIKADKAERAKREQVPIYVKSDYGPA
ncbi:uncharacterized protein LOC112341537 [Selaginella moellendorffii]|uniref:uncharacterized protein LOC112341537 n=1 Tax=Selaginella moellendorffii TaxID=88036 RepID=UPI000D1C6E03|nr:uncharacterized protein LOC112341537 [Selaginella moellendorffii]|eukprot:XP_024517572.1 uncharacterized protein LOC112341537 [Selaginella moellendorffii]